MGREVELVQRAQRGDHAAFDELAGAAFPGLWQVARRTLGDPARADDAVQECLVRAWRDLRALRDPARFDAWLRRLLLRACIDDWRRTRRAPVTVSVDRLEPVAEVDAGSLAERRDLLERAFSRLPVEQRMVVVLHHYLGLRLVEIAQELGIPEGTVTSRLHYGVRALRAAVEADLRAAEGPVASKAAR